MQKDEIGHGNEMFNDCITFCYLLVPAMLVSWALAICLTLVKSGGRNPGRHVAGRLSFFFTVAPNTCGFLVWSLLHVTLLPPWIFRWLLDFWKCLCTPWFNFEVSGIAIFTRKGTRASVLCGYRNDSRRGSDGSSARAHHTGLSWLDKRIFAYCAIDIIKS